ncbi:MAG TPA: pilus assembly PilX N-terminal domain-containing protein [Polyangiaceae bacterium]|jgi:Tfp pilus assembly protein PilX
MNPLPVLVTPLARAKQRARRRAAAMGGTMFVVAMTIAVLSAIGVWAIQSAALEVRMAGYERQNAQTHYLAEYGILAAMQDLAPGFIQNILPIAVCGVGGTREVCTSAPWSAADPANAKPLGKACHRWSNATALTSQFIPSGMTAIDSMDAGAPGSFGLNTLQGDFNVELTEVAQGPQQQGTSTGGMVFYWVTLQSDGKTQQALSGTNYAAYYGSEGDEQLRTRVLAGPIAPLNLTGCPQ